MSSKLYDLFTKKFNANLGHGSTAQQAFDKTNDEMGFEAYSSYNSYQTVRKRKKATRK